MAGSISGKIYVDVNNNGTFDSPDIPYAVPLSFYGPTEGSGVTSESGDFEFTDLPAGTYTVGIAIALPQGCIGLAPFNWVGGPQDTVINCGSGPRIEPYSQTVELAEGQQQVGVNFRGIPWTSFSGRAWMDGKAAASGSIVSVTVGSYPCWQTTVTRDTTDAAVTIADYSLDLKPLSDSRCENGDIAFLVNGQMASETFSWQSFWARRIWSRVGAETLDGLNDLMAPGFTGLSGKIMTDEIVSQQGPNDFVSGEAVSDGTVVQVFAGGTLCGQASTQTLNAPFDRWQNLFGLVALSADLKSGCAQQNQPMTLCAGGFEARQTAYPGSIVLPPESEPIIWQAVEIKDLTLVQTTDPCPISAFPPTGGSLRSSARVWILVALLGAALAGIGIMLSLQGIRSSGVSSAMSRSR